MIRFTRIKFEPYEIALTYYLNEPRGQVGRYLYDKSITFITAAQRQVGVRTGELRSSITIHQKSRTKTGQTWKIGSYMPYAAMHHEGTRPHMIQGKRVNQYRRRVLRFSQGGTVVFAHRVMHPGTRPNRYLSDNLRIFIA